MLMAMDTLQTLSPATHPAVVQNASEQASDGANEWMTDGLRRAIERVNAWHWQHEQLRLQSLAQPFADGLPEGEPS